MHVGPVAIAPGQTRMVDPGFLNPTASAAPAEPPKPEGPPGELVELLARKPGEIKAALAELSDEALAQLQALESAEAKPRTSVLEAITAETLRRSQPPA